MTKDAQSEYHVFVIHKTRRNDVPFRLLPAALLAFATLLGAGSEVRAQGPLDERFAEPVLPTPDLNRLANGQPGPAYWQQRADYSIRVTLDPASNTITGSE